MASDLLTRLREAKEGSRELDAEIHAALFPDDAVRLIGPHPLIGPRYYVRDSSHMPTYTTDLSAAVALCERALPGWNASGTMIGQPVKVAVVEPSPLRPMPIVAKAATPALALCLAILTAKEATHDRN